MRSSLASAVLAAALVVAAGHTPALAQDFSITNPSDLRVEGAKLPADWLKQLRAYWDLHAYYPKEAAEKNEAGTIKVHLLIHADGDVFLVKVVQGCGNKTLDEAGFYVFHNAHLRPFPPGVTAGEADLYVSLHYVLGHPATKAPFTVTNEPVHGAVFETMQDKLCTGTAVLDGNGRADSVFGRRFQVQVIFFRKPDGSEWVKWWDEGGVLFVIPAIGQGLSAHWTGPPRLIGHLQ